MSPDPTKAFFLPVITSFLLHHEKGENKILKVSFSNEPLVKTYIFPF